MSYQDTQQKIQKTLTGRNSGTQITPDSHQNMAETMLNYIQEVENISVSSIEGIAYPDTEPLQPDAANVVYISAVPSNTTYTYKNFADENGDAISITAKTDPLFVILFWNKKYWSYLATTSAPHLHVSAELTDSKDEVPSSKAVSDALQDIYKRSNPNDKDGNIIDTNTIFAVTNNDTFAIIIKDLDGKFLGGFEKKDGNFVFVNKVPRDIQDAINASAKQLQTADQTLQENIDAEIKARQTADQTLQENIDAEIKARQTADQTLQENIDAEIQAEIDRATTAENAILNNITQTTGDSTTSVMSQKAVTDKINNINASNITYNHTDSHLDASNVQQAVDEIKGNIDELQDSVNEINQEIQVTDNGPDDFSIQDEAGNILCLWKDGHIKTKNFDSEKVATKEEVSSIEHSVEVNDNADSDLDISDENGNVLVRFANGHFQVKNFSSLDVLDSIQAILSNVGFDNIPEFDEESDYAVGDIVRYGKYVYVFTSVHTAGVWNESEVERTVINTEHPVDVENNENESDLDISDENGNILIRCKNGNIKTKHFDSSQIIGEEQMANILTGIQNLNTRVDNMPLSKGIILDTDWWTDVDDAVAIRCLLWAERCGLVDLVGVCVDAVNSTSGKSIAAFLNEEGRGGLAIGMDKQATDYNGNPPYHSTCINNWAYYDDILSNDNCEDCVSFYRRALVNSSKKIDIICIGYGNALQRLLNSTSDSISPLTGRELILEKVNKLWWMAGKYPNGSENNFNRTSRSRAAGADICTNWPTPIVFLGYEVGETVISGNNLSTDVNSNDLLYKCLVALGSNGRSSWDPMTVLLACYDNFDIAGYTVVQGINSVNASTGANTFTVNNQGNHYYVVKKYADWWYAHQINKIISLTSWTSRKLGAQQIDRL